MASEELKEIYDLLSKKLNTKIKNELEYLRKRNAELEKEVIDSIMNYLSISKIQLTLEENWKLSIERRKRIYIRDQSRN